MLITVRESEKWEFTPSKWRIMGAEWMAVERGFGRVMGLQGGGSG